MKRARKPVGRVRWSREGRGPAFAASLALHMTVGGSLFLGPTGRRPPTPPVYQVELVAAPRSTEQRRPAPEVVQRPPRQTESVPQLRQREAIPEPAVPAPPDEREPPARAQPVDSLPEPTEPSTGTDVANVKTSGVAFPFPEYLRNIVSQVYRRWHRPTGNVSLRAEVLFFIRRDGSVSNLQFTRRSGNFGFDLEAQGAIEAAANARAFGPLPEGFPADVLPVSFFFDPTSTR